MYIYIYIYPAWLLRSNPASIDPSFAHEGASGSTAGMAPGGSKRDHEEQVPKAKAKAKAKAPPKAKTASQEAKGVLWFIFNDLDPFHCVSFKCLLYFDIWVFKYVILLFSVVRR